ncbi:MAG: STAS domain-containing protein [Alphaproteobacteria bacterium]|nr:STAS domain-containing protein [Alphaproteobacteria bacterium]
MKRFNWAKTKKSIKRHFTPKIVEIFRKKYTLKEFKRDCIAALTVSVVSIPLAMALAIASGVEPAQGLYTAVIAGFLTALFGGSRYQIGGPTGAFVIVIFGIVHQYGYPALLTTMIMAGIILMIAGFFRFGTYIKYIPYPVIVGFTAGIGVILISTQIKDLFGLDIADVPAAFLPKWESYLTHLHTTNIYAVLITIVSATLIFGFKKFLPKSPYYLIGVTGATVLVVVCGLSVDTIGSKFGSLPHFLPKPQWDIFNASLIFKMFPSALTIAFLAGVESLLSAKVVDGMSGDNHNSNVELVAQGIANIGTAFFSGIPATGAIARTATNFKANAYSPVSGIMQSVFLLVFMVALASVAQYIPLACLSVVLILIGWNMLGLDKIYQVMGAQAGDRNVLIVTFLLTVFVDLNTAISVGFMMATIIFMHRMSHEIEIETEDKMSREIFGGESLPENLMEKGVIALRVSGPLFFGGVNEIAHFFNQLRTKPKILILRMGQVPLVDASGANLIVEFIKKLEKAHTKIILCNIKKQPRRVLHNTFLREHLDWHTISTASNYQNAVKMAKRCLRQIK